jgi:hypothetical protein
MRCAAAANAAAGPASLLRAIQQRVASKQQSAVEVTQAYLAQLKSVEGQVHAFLAVDEAAALAQVCWCAVLVSRSTATQRGAGRSSDCLHGALRPHHLAPSCTRRPRWTPRLLGARQQGRWPACPSLSR